MVDFVNCRVWTIFLYYSCYTIFVNLSNNWHGIKLTKSYQNIVLWNLQSVYINSINPFWYTKLSKCKIKILI